MVELGDHQSRRLGNHPLPLIPSILLLCPGPRDVSKVSLVHLSTFASVGVHMNPCAFHLVPSHSLDQIDLKSTSMSERDCALVWGLKIPLRVHFFLWPFSMNKLLTRDNLNIRRKVKDLSCLFCTKVKIVHHIFFDGAIAWKMSVIFIGV